MNAPWIALFLFTSAWLLAVPVYETPDVSAIYLGVAGLFLFSMCLPRLRFDSIPKRVYFLIPCPVAFALMIPSPYNVAGYVTLAGFALMLLCHRVRRMTPIAGGVMLAGGVLLLQSLALALFYYASPNLKDAGFVAPALYAGLKSIGSDATLGDGVVYVATLTEIMRLWPTWDHLGLFYIFLTLSGGLPLVFLSRSPKRSTLVLLAVTAVYVLLRYIVLSVFVAAESDRELYWKNSWNAASFLPLYLILEHWIHVRASKKGLPARLSGLSLRPRQLGFGTLIVIATFALVGYAGLADSGVKKQGRILIDEHHSDWEWTEKEYDTEWYGMESGYNYYNLFDYLGYFYNVERGDSRLTPEVLGGYDVLVIKTPTRRFEGDEINAIVDFVENGGGLYLVGDHTNVFGTSTFLNEISERFGFSFRYDSTYDLQSGALSLFQHSRILPDVIVQNMPPFLFATSCSIEGGPRCRPVINGYRLRVLAADYSQDSFFPEKAPHRDYGYGLYTQTISAKRGKGRVVGFSDSTVFSNFFMFIPGKPDLALGTFEWLNRENAMPRMGLILILSFAAAALLAAVAGRRIEPLPRALIALNFVLLALPLSIGAARGLNAGSYPPPEPHTEFTRVSFEGRHSRFFIPTLRLTREGDKDFHTFYVWTQRLGLVPNWSPSIDHAVEKGDLVVLIDPTWPFAPQELEKLRTYVEGGGNLLVLDDRTAVRSTANQLLSPFGMTIDTTAVVLDEEDLGSPEAQLFREAGRVIGGTPMLSTSGGDAIISYTQRGAGTVMACSNSHIFGLESMGPTGVDPTPIQRRIYDLEFAMLRKLLDLPD